MGQVKERGATDGGGEREESEEEKTEGMKVLCAS